MSFIKKTQSNMKFEVGSLYEYEPKINLKHARLVVLIPFKGPDYIILSACSGPIMFLESKVKKHIKIHEDNIGEFPVEVSGWKVLYKNKNYILTQDGLDSLQEYNVFLKKIC